MTERQARKKLIAALRKCKRAWTIIDVSRAIRELPAELRAEVDGRLVKRGKEP